MPLLSRALGNLLRASGDPLRDLAAIGPDHPSHARAEVLRAGIGVLAKTPAALPAIARAISAADTLRLPPRLRAHLDAAERWVRGEPEQAAQRYADILARWPHDLLALRLAHSCYFFLGQPQPMCASVDAVMPAWNGNSLGCDFVRAMGAFAHAEAGHAERAEQLGRAALARDPACPMGVHAVAHAIAESGRPGDGARWLRGQRAHWAVPSRMLTHNAWHLAMFDVDDGHLVPALRILDTWLMPAAAQSPVDACDAVSLLWRIASEGLNVGGRWEQLSSAFEQRSEPGFWPYVDLHAALAHLRAARRERFERLVHEVEQRTEDTHSIAARARDTTLPLLRALATHDHEVRARAAATIAKLGPLLGAAGGSRLQLEFLAPPSASRSRSVRPAAMAGPAAVASWRRQAAGGEPNSRLKARLKAASDS